MSIISMYCATSDTLHSCFRNVLSSWHSPDSENSTFLRHAITSARQNASSPSFMYTPLLKSSYEAAIFPYIYPGWQIRLSSPFSSLQTSLTCLQLGLWTKPSLPLTVFSIYKYIYLYIYLYINIHFVKVDDFVGIERILVYDRYQ